MRGKNEVRRGFRDGGDGDLDATLSRCLIMPYRRMVTKPASALLQDVMHTVTDQALRPQIEYLISAGTGQAQFAISTLCCLGLVGCQNVDLEGPGKHGVQHMLEGQFSMNGPPCYAEIGDHATVKKVNTYIWQVS